MEKVERIGISIEKELLDKFDRLIDNRGYANRSEAVRDLIRKELSNEKLSDPQTQAIGAVCVVYDHHATKLLQRLMGLGHSHLLETICSTHIHLDAHDCMELIVLKGRAGEIRKVAENILSQKGVKLGRINLVSKEVD